jgi:hypothetical protein
MPRETWPVLVYVLHDQPARIADTDSATCSTSRALSRRLYPGSVLFTVPAMNAP